MTLIQKIDREALFDRKRAARKAGIAALIADGIESDPVLAMMHWDTECAPLTTNLEQLREIGFIPPAPATLNDDELPPVLEALVAELAVLGLYLSSTNHLGDRQLYSILVDTALRDRVRDIPPTHDMSEFIDFATLSPSGAPGEGPFPAVSSRDASLPRPPQLKAAQPATAMISSV